MTKIVLLILNLSLLSVICCTCHGLNVTKLYLLGLYPISGRVWPGAQACLPATNLALQDINENPSILPGYEVVLIPTDTACDGGRATDSMYSELYNTSTTKVMVIGGGCSVATEPTAHASHYWNLIQISYSAASPKLSLRSLYPLFFRLSPPQSASNVAYLALFRVFGWKKMATIHQSVALYSLAFADFHRKASREGLEIIAAESFIDDPTTQVESIKKSGARIIVGGFYDDQAIKVFCAAYHQGLFGAKYVWIIPGYFNWNRLREQDNSIDCSPEQIQTAVANHIGVHSLSLPPDVNQTTALAGMTTSQFMERFKAISGADDPEKLIGIQEAPFAYDTIWTAALALHATEQRLGQLDPPRSLKDYAYDRVTVDIIFDVLSNLSFKGITGPVKFTSSGDRIGLIQINQIQGDDFVSIGQMDPAGETGENIIWNGFTPIYWPNGAPPIDFIIEREDRQTIYISVFLTGASLAVSGVAIACCFLAFNIHFRKLRVIKMSSPNINNLMLIGGMLAYVSIIFLGVDTALVTSDTFVWMCKAKTWCLSIGFSLAFGSMFSKTWRVHKIFTNKTVIKTVVKDSLLLSSVAILVLLDVMILILWEIVDPLTAVEKLGEKVVDSTNDDIVYIPIRMMCESGNQTFWIGAFYVIDGLLLVFGAFLAWETRKVSIPALNDSKYIGICLYNVLILSFVGAPVSFVLEERNAHYALLATLVWLATTLTLCVVFVPKIRMRNDVRPAQSTMVSHANTGFQSTHSEHAQREIDSLRQEVQRLKRGPSETKQQHSERN